MTTAAAKQTALVTKDELLELAEAEAAYQKAKQKLSAAEDDVKLRRLQLAEKVLGVKTEDEMKALEPGAVTKKFLKRFEAGDWKLERGAPEFQFINTHKGRYPAWAKLYAAEIGQSEAARITAETDYSYSYRVDVQVA